MEDVVVGDHPSINTGLGLMPVPDVMKYIRGETEREPSTTEPRDSSVLLGMLRALPSDVHKYAALWLIDDFKKRSPLFENETAQRLLREARMIAYAPMHEEPSEWVCFGDFSRNEFGQQCQYGARYLHGEIDGWPKLLDDDSQITGNPHHWHEVRIHVDALPALLNRYKEHCAR